MTAAASLSHDRAIDLAAAAPAFALSSAESRDLATHLRACADCRRRAARLRSDLAAIGAVDPALSPRLHDRLREVAVTTPRSGPGALGIVLVFVLLAVGVVGVSLGVGALGGDRAAVAPMAVLPPQPDDVLAWSTEVVELRATSFGIDAGGHHFDVPAGAAVSSDPGNLTSWTLEARWQDGGARQRLNLYFSADATSWWIRQVQVDDGATGDKAEWATWRTPQLPHVPLGEAFAGDIDLSTVAATGPVRLQIGGLRIAVRPQDPVTEPIGGQRVRVPENADVRGIGSPLRCSGILQLPPQAAELRLQSMGYALSWRLETRTSGNTGYSAVMATAPTAGWITDVVGGSQGELIVFVSDPGRPFGDPIPLPADCTTP